jgi:hypothetical protein
MPKNGAVRSASRLQETLLVLSLVLVFFLLFTSVLFRLFPSGVSLTAIFQARALGGSTKQGETVNAAQSQQSGPQSFSAKLTRSVNEVKSKGSASIAWQRAQEGMDLYDNDSIQTQENSSANISFDSKNYLKLSAKTLIVIKRNEKNPFSDYRRSTVDVVGGQVEGRIQSDALDINTKNGVIRLNSESKPNQETLFKLSERSDQSTVLTIQKGIGEVLTQGKSWEITENKGITMRPGQEPVVVDLPDPPRTETPGENGLEYFRELPPKINFTWHSIAQTRYRIQIATQRDFSDFVIDTVIERPEFAHGNLQAGVYFWRVSSISNGLEGIPGKVSRLELVKKAAPPDIQVFFPDGAVNTNRYALRGISTPPETVYVNNEQVLVDKSGKFIVELNVRPGMNLVTVEAVDRVGNAAYKSGYIEGRY